MQNLKLFLIFLCLFFSQLLIGNTKTSDPEKLILITGCGRSGTLFTADFLNLSGIPVGHEQMGENGVVSWLMAAHVDWAPWGPLSKSYKFKHIFHQIRNPIKVIQSYYNFPPDATWEWIHYVIPAIELTDSNLTKCAKYWYYWNLMAEEKAEWSYRIEDIDSEYQEMAKRLGITLDPNVLKSISTKTHTRGPPLRTITWEILQKELDPDLFHKVQTLATRYHY